MILSTHESSRVRNLAMSALHSIAADQLCEVSDIIALIIPSQPEPSSSRPPAADMPDAPAGDTTDGDLPPASPSVEPDASVGRTADEQALAGVSLDPVVPTSLPGAEGAADRAPETDKSVEPSGSAAPSLLDKIIACHKANPDWPARMIARHLGVSHQRVATAAYLGKVGIPKQADYDAAKKAATVTALASAKRKTAASDRSIKERFHEAFAENPDWTLSQFVNFLGAGKSTIAVYLSDARKTRELSNRPPTPLPTPQTPIAPPPPPGATLTLRVAYMLQMHPTWTARMIAQELGADTHSVSTLLAKARGVAAKGAEPSQPFRSRAEMLSHYSEVAKRLGKAS